MIHTVHKHTVYMHVHIHAHVVRETVKTGRVLQGTGKPFAL